MQAGVEATARRLRLLATVLVTTVAVLAATATGASAASSPCGPTDPRICVQNVGTPPTVAPSTVDFPTFVSYTVTVTNRASSTATHVALTDTLPAGSQLNSVTTTTGFCTSGVTAVNCAFGSLASGITAAVTIVVEAPRTEGPVTNTAAASFDEGPADNPANPGKQDTVTVAEGTSVDPGAAESLVPSNMEVRLDTSPTHATSATPADPTIGKARVPASDHPPLTASLNEDPAPFVCPKKVICRNGAWVHADIGDGRAFSPALEFELHWSKVLVPKQQTVKNLAVLKTECLAGCGDPIVISRRCSSSNPAPAELPCLSNIVETATEFQATLHSSENGYMR
jgi:uncharacterized repeat protein (TIGR01451 family)